MTAPTGRPTVIDLFSGAGGFSLGFHAAGCQILAALDSKKAPIDTYRYNFNRLQPDARPEVIQGDAADTGNDVMSVLKKLQPPDIIIGGPPCQGFSKIGRGKLDSLSTEGFANDPRNLLYKRFLDALKLLQPKAFVMENVTGMLSVVGQNIAAGIVRDFRECGYDAGYAVLNTVWYGVPQFRERVFFVGVREDLKRRPSVPQITHDGRLPSGYMPLKREDGQLALDFDLFTHSSQLPVEKAEHLETLVTVREALDDLTVLKDHLAVKRGTTRGDFRRKRKYNNKAKPSPYAQNMRFWPGLSKADSVDDHVIRHTPRDFETFGRMKHLDRYLEAIVIANSRFEEAVRKLGTEAPTSGTPEYENLRKRFVPPYPTDKFMDKWRKLHPDLPSWTVPAHLSKDTYSHIHYDHGQKRAISVREAARLQSFPDAFKFKGNMGDCFTQIGNAVAPLLARKLAEEIIKLLK